MLQNLLELFFLVSKALNGPYSIRNSRTPFLTFPDSHFQDRKKGTFFYMTDSCCPLFEKSYKKVNLTIKVKDTLTARMMSTFKANPYLNKSYLKQAWIIFLRSLLMHLTDIIDGWENEVLMPQDS